MSAHCRLTVRKPGFGNSISLPTGAQAPIRPEHPSPHTSAEDRAAAQAELRRQPRDAGATRVRNQDAVDGRPRGYQGAFGLSRINLRGLAHAGHLPGVRKSGW